MAYNSTTQTITAPVSIRDVQRALGNSNTDLGTLISRGSINMWSKHKPTNQYGMSLVTESDLTTRNQWWVGVQRNRSAGVLERYNIRTYGYHPVNGDNMLSLVQGQSYFSYVRPDGGRLGTGFPMRLDDFDGYVHAYTYPNISNTRPFSVDMYTDEQQWGGTVSFTLNIGFTYDSNVLTLRDIFNTSNMHIGMLFITNDSSDTSAGGSGATFRLVSISRALSSIQPGNTYSDNNIRVYMVDGYTYNVEVTLRKSGETVGGVTYSKAFPQSWIGKSITCLPVFTTATFDYDAAGDSSAYVYSLVTDPDVRNDVIKEFTLLESNPITTAYKRPSVIFDSVGTIGRNGTTITCPDFVLRATSQGGFNTTGQYVVQVTNINVAVQRYIASADTTVYYSTSEGNKVLTSANITIDASTSSAGHTATRTFTDGPSCVAAGYEAKRQLVISVSVRCQKGDTSDYDVWDVIKIMDIDN